MQIQGEPFIHPQLKTLREFVRDCPEIEGCPLAPNSLPITQVDPGSLPDIIGYNLYFPFSSGGLQPKSLDKPPDGAYNSSVTSEFSFRSEVWE